MDDLLQHFIVEAHELIQQATDDLLSHWNAIPRHSRTHGQRLSRRSHPQGIGRPVRLPPMGIALHAAEDLLGDLRERRDGIDAPVIDSLLACIGQTERWVAIIEQTGQLPPDAAEEGYRWRGCAPRARCGACTKCGCSPPDRSRLDRGTGGPEPQPRKLGGTGCTAGSDPVHAARRLLFLGRRPDCAPALGSRSDGSPAPRTGIPGRPRGRSIHSHAI